jgi:hypothetical protein
MAIMFLVRKKYVSQPPSPVLKDQSSSSSTTVEEATPSFLLRGGTNSVLVLYVVDANQLHARHQPRNFPGLRSIRIELPRPSIH